MNRSGKSGKSGKSGNKFGKLSSRTMTISEAMDAKKLLESRMDLISLSESPPSFVARPSTGCPYGYGNEPTNEAPKAGRGSYNSYLQLEKLLDCQQMASGVEKAIHDEHLFIITHQAYELWFKQILHELDSIRRLFSAKVVDEGKTLVIISRLARISLILQLLVDQFAIMETMTPLDFLEFRGHLESGSGFQSLQFRLLENKLGLLKDNRIDYNQENYQKVFENEREVNKLQTSIDEPSLIELVIEWLERTPGLDPEEFDFIKKYESSVNKWLKDEYLNPALEEKCPATQKSRLESYNKQKAAFEEVIQAENYEASLKRRERRFSHKAFQGALMIMLYRDEPRFHQPFQILTLLMDIDSHVTKWRYTHVTMVQRMIGSKIGTGGSSGYLYLRATASDRYKVFLDLFNMATYLVPRHLIPPLTGRMKKQLSIVMRHSSEDSDDGVNSSSADGHKGACR